MSPRHPSSSARRLTPAIFLVLLGLAQMIGDVLGILPLKGVAAATGASPAPKVFSAVQGPLPGTSLGSLPTRFEAPCERAEGQGPRAEGGETRPKSARTPRNPRPSALGPQPS